MVTHRVWVRALPFGQAVRRFAVVCLAVSIAAMIAAATRTAHAEAATSKVKAEEADTEHMFGFIEGSEIGALGESELLMDTTGRFGKAAGSYKHISHIFEAKHTLSERFRVSAAA